MKKVVLASLLAAAVAGPVAYLGLSATAYAQPAGQAPAGGQIQMNEQEYKDYNDANSQSTPAAKAAGFENYLTKYPQSAVKADVLLQLVALYGAINDTSKTLTAVDRLMQVDPNNIRGLVYEVSLRRAAADALTDPSAKQAGYDAAADWARKGLAATKPAAMSDADFTTVKNIGYPIFYSAIGIDALVKKDTAGAIDAFKKELHFVPVAATTQPGSILQDTFNLGQAYYTSTPPDYLNCAYYGSRAAFYAPEPFKTQFSQISTYCYRRYHGKNDGYDALVAISKDNLDPPADLKVTPAPKPADIVADLIATTPDLATLAISDKEYVLQYGKQEDADKLFATIKGKSVELPDVTVISAAADTLTVAVSEDAVANTTADFTFKMKEPLTTLPEKGSKINISGTYDSYTQNPVMISMTDGAVVEKKKAAPVKKTTTPARRPAASRRR